MSAGTLSVGAAGVPDSAVVGRLVLRADALAAQASRRYVDRACAAWGVADSYEARLIASELVTDAHRHAEGEWVTVRASLDSEVALVRGVRRYVSSVVIEVWAPDARLPRVMEEECVRGVGIVSVIADRWGCFRVAEAHGGGKVVWATVLV
ncbi:hypothetical protein [Actinomadura sp. 6N118]|uniref:hypothetical protein n=1 Tax=Actinomadura sp. 6N118 TaxID=3375151 RepID=UPI0037B03F0B